MMNKRRPSQKYCTYNEFYELLPVFFARNKVLQMAQRGQFPPYFRPGDRKSEPLFDRVEVHEWIKAKFSKFFPEEVSALVRSDFVFPRG